MSPIPKLLEKLILPILSGHLPLAAYQHGFQKSSITNTALQMIQHKIQEGLITTILFNIYMKDLLTPPAGNH